MDRIPSPVLQLFEYFDQANLSWALIRPWQGLLSPDGDIDVLVARAELERVRGILVRAGYVPMPVGGKDIHAAKFDLESGSFFWVHVQSELAAGQFKLGAERLLGTVRRSPLPELDGDWLMWALLIRAVEKRKVPEKYRDRLAELGSKWRDGPTEPVDFVSRVGLDPRALVDAAIGRNWAYFESLPRQHSEQEVKAKSPLTTRLARIMRGLLDRRRQGLSVAVIGPDGAGKSTLIEGLERTLPLRTRKIYMGLTSPKMVRAQSLRFPVLIFPAQVAVLWLQYAKGLLYRAAGQIVLFDRYALDGAVAAGTTLSAWARLARRIQRWVVPMPDLVLLLNVSGQTMFERKGEYDANTLEQWRCQYLLLQGRISQLATIDAEQPADQVLRAAQELLWNRLGDRATSCAVPTAI